MKKFLSLVLALVMTMSLVTVSAGAKDFTDSEDLSGEAYAEAVNVMSEMGIIDGYAGGAFQPQGTLTRGAAAKIIACMMLGKTTAEALGTQAAPFKDVPVGSTFAGYIAYCVESGLIDGYADGTFVAFNSKMSSCMLNALNAENVLDKGGNGLTLENLVSMNPDIIVYVRADRFGSTDADAVEQLTSNAVVQEVPAIANQKVIEMDYDDVMDYGARVIDSAETLYNG